MSLPGFIVEAGDDVRFDRYILRAPQKTKDGLQPAALSLVPHIPTPSNCTVVRCRPNCGFDPVTHEFRCWPPQHTTGICCSLNGRQWCTPQDC